MKGLVTHLALAVLAALISVGTARAQERPLVVGYTDFEDSFTSATGMKTALSRIRGLELVEIDVGRPGLFRPESLDVLMLSSFVELHPDWDVFARAARPGIEAMLRDGGALVLFARGRKADREGDPGFREPVVPDLGIERGSKHPASIFVCSGIHPMWDPVGGRGDVEGWKTLRVGPMANRQGWVQDCFDTWDESSVRASARMRKGGEGAGRAMALHARRGDGEIHLFQMILDKIDGTTDAAGLEISREFFDGLLAHLESRPRRRRPPPRAEVEAPTPRGEIDEPEVAPRVESMTVSGRVFLDLDGDGTFGAGDRPVPGARLSDEVASFATDAAGRFRLVVATRAPRSLHLEIPDALETLEGAPWWRSLPAGRTEPMEGLDFPLVPIEGSASALVVAFALEAPSGPKGLAELRRGLDAVLADGRPDLLLVFPGSGGGSGGLDWAAPLLDPLVLEFGVDVRVVLGRSGPPGALAGQPSRSARIMGGHQVVLLGSAQARAGWNNWVGKHAPDALFASPELLGPVELERLKGGVTLMPPGIFAEGPGRVSVPLLDGEGARLLVQLTPGEAPEILRPARRSAASGEAEVPSVPEPPSQEESAPPLPLHPLVAGDLEAALRRALGGD